MKYRIIGAVFLIAVYALSLGCSHKMVSSSDVPDWYLNPPVAEDAFYGVGEAAKQNPALAKKAADQRARDDIVTQVKARVSTLMKDFMEETNLGEMGAISREYTMAVSEQVGSMVLEGCKIEKRDIRRGTYYSLASYNILAAREAILQKARDEARKNEELYNKFIAQQAFDELEQKVKDFNSQ